MSRSRSALPAHGRGEAGRTVIPCCQRCSGQLFYSDDHYGPYWQCLACGHIVENGLSQAQAVAEVTQKDGEKRAYPPKHGKMRL